MAASGRSCAWICAGRRSGCSAPPGLVVEEGFAAGALLEDLRGDQGLLPLRSPFNTTISRVERAVRASPLAKVAICSRVPGAMATFWSPKPRGSCSARARSSVRSSTERAWSTNTLHRDRRAEFTSKLGFSVVAPMRTMEPFSTKGRKASCWALLKRWISSTKRMVRSPMRRPCSACLHHLFDLFDAAGDGAEVDEVGAGAPGDDAGQGGLNPPPAGPRKSWRTPGPPR